MVADELDSPEKTETVRLQPMYPDFSEAPRNTEAPLPAIVSPNAASLERARNDMLTGLDYYMARLIAALIWFAWTGFNITAILRKLVSDQLTFDQSCIGGRWVNSVVFFLLGVRAAFAWRAGAKSFEPLKRPRSYLLPCEIGAAVLFFGFVAPAENLHRILSQNGNHLGPILTQLATIVLMALGMIAFFSVVMGHVASMWSVLRYSDMCLTTPWLRSRAVSVGKSARVQMRLIGIASVVVPVTFTTSLYFLSANRALDIFELSIGAIAIATCGILALTTFAQGIATLHQAKSLLRTSESDDPEEISPQKAARFDFDGF